MNGTSQAAFISYASQDAEAASRICEALRAAGIEVWFDRSELRGGDAWDQKIRREIRDCALFIPLISENTAARAEGYFRLEWSLADARSHMIARNKAFIVPVCLDQTPESGADVPESFQRVQWTRLPGGDTPLAFTARIAALLGVPVTAWGSTTALVTLPGEVRAARPKRTSRVPLVAIALATLVVAALAYVVLERFQLSKQPPADRHLAAVVPAPAVPAIPEKSVAVLPFVDMSEKKDQEYFSDGMSEELIDMLTKVRELQVPARTSSFYFKGKQATIAEIARALGVAHVLEGSVRKSGNTLRVTAQLIRADNGYHLWSQTYDRPFDDVFKMQDEIAGAVVQALKVSLLAGGIPETTVIQNPETYALYLQARHLFQHAATKGDLESAIEYLQRALRLDPKFARAWALLARVRTGYFAAFLGSSQQMVRRDAEDDAKRALALDPKLADSHLAMAAIYDEIDWDWEAAETEFSQALQLEPGNTRALAGLANISLTQDRLEQALQYAQSAVTRDPLNAFAYWTLGRVQSRRGQHARAETAGRKALELNPTGHYYHFWVGYELLAQGEPAAALAEFARELDKEVRLEGLVLALPALGRTEEAERVAAEMERDDAATSAANLAAYYACRKDSDRAFAWLDRAYLQHDGYLEFVKGDFCFKNLAHDPRYKAFLRKMNMPE